MAKSIKATGAVSFRVNAIPMPKFRKATSFLKFPACTSCGHEMKDSGLADITESLTVIPKRFVVIRQFRHKFCCRHCHGSMTTAEAPARIVPRSSYNDELIIDVTVSKYCDLIPVERYGKMAERQGLAGLPPHSLIELTIQLAFFMRETYKRRVPARIRKVYWKFEQKCFQSLSECTGIVRMRRMASRTEVQPRKP